jgi:hypothetical protein
MRNTYEVIGSLTYVNIRGARNLEKINGDISSVITHPKEVGAVHAANILANDAEEAIRVFKNNVDNFASEHHYANGGDAFATDLVTKFDAIESVGLLAVGVYE